MCRQMNARSSMSAATRVSSARHPEGFQHAVYFLFLSAHGDKKRLNPRPFCRVYHINSSREMAHPDDDEHKMRAVLQPLPAEQQLAGAIPQSLIRHTI